VQPCQAETSAHAKCARVLVMGGRGLVRLFCAGVQLWLAGRAETGWSGKDILSCLVSRLVTTDVVGVWRGWFKRGEARCDGERSGGMMIQLLADGVGSAGWILRSFICLRNNAYLHTSLLRPSAIVPQLQQPYGQPYSGTTHYPQTLLNPHSPPI
jgi:hypothetical protein